MTFAFPLVIALLLDAALGEPKWLWHRLPHPAVLMGRLVDGLDQRLNRGAQRRLAGVFALIVLVAVALLVGIFIAALPFGPVIEIIVAAMILAQRSLADHVAAVADALRLSLVDGRRAVAKIVGRDTSDMDAPAVARGAIESAAENLSDGVIAPAFWFLIGGLPAMLAYKIVNTADSMIGYRTPRHQAFGWATARFDDLLNWIPARLTAALIALAHARPDAARIIRRDAALHRSPNAGWPEAAMAVVLNIALSGPRTYEGEARDFPFVYPEGRPPLAPDIDAAVRALWRSWTLLILIIAVLALI
ncbi:MAG: cobalamin biosynthesis protein [Rhodobacteraceae bacterium]|nr:cobalamin biosynthesis protein [Paracoccaceae bacterium]